MLNTPLGWVTMWRLHMLLGGGSSGNRVCTRISLCSYPISCLLRKVIADSSEYNYKSALVDFSLCSPLDATKVILPPVLPCYTLLIKIDNLIDSVAQSNTRRPIVKELKNNIWPKPNFIRSSCHPLRIKKYLVMRKLVSCKVDFTVIFCDIFVRLSYWAAAKAEEVPARMPVMKITFCFLIRVFKPFTQHTYR